MARRRRDQGTQWDVDNRVGPNPAVFITVFVLAAALAGLFVLFWLVF